MVVAYDPAWADRYEQESALIAGALSELVVGIEHVGSTAVPGLVAKSIVDVMVGVRQLSDGKRCIAPLDNVGYEYRGDGGFPNHLFWRKGDPRQVHLHMVEHENDFWREHVSFRDKLRASQELIQEYAALKKRLAHTYHHEKQAYTDAKGPFIQAVLERARRG